MTILPFVLDRRKRRSKIQPLYYHYRSQLYPIIYPITLLHHRRIAGIEPASSPWQGEILPFDHIRVIFVPDIHVMSLHI